MRGFVYTHKNHMELQDLPLPNPGPKEVVVKVNGCGVCGTDIHIFHGEVPLAKPPVVLGHEIVGTVYGLGSGVSDLHEGQAVCLNPVISCLECDYCHSGRYNLCKNPTVLGYHVTGGFAEFTKAPRSHVHPIDAKVGVKGGVIVEPLACVLNGYDRLGLQPGRNVLVLGAGPIGLIWTQLLAHSPLTKIAQTDKVKSRCEKAKMLGANHVIHVVAESLHEFVGDVFPEGFDYVIDVTGDPAAVEEGLNFVKRGGTFMVFGVAPYGSRCNIDPYRIFDHEIKIIGAKMPPMTLSRAVALVESGQIDYHTIISDVYPLEQLPNAFSLFEKGQDKVLKMAVKPNRCLELDFEAPAL